MPNLGVKQIESAARQRVVVHQEAVDVLNILAFVETFLLQYINFDLECGQLSAWFLPRDTLVDGIFTVDKRILSQLKDVVYTEREFVRSVGGAVIHTGKCSSVRAVVSSKDIILEDSGGSYKNKRGEDRTGSVFFGVKIGPKNFPPQQWKHRSRILVFCLQNGQEYKFQCDQ